MFPSGPASQSPIHARTPRVCQCDIPQPRRILIAQISTVDYSGADEIYTCANCGGIVQNEQAILEERQRAILSDFTLGNQLTKEIAVAPIDELAEIEVALRKYDGTMNDIADAQREARFGCAL